MALMQSDIQSTRLTASGSVFGGPGRVKGVYFVAGASAGTVEIRDGGASGTVLVTLDTPADATVTRYLEIPSAGVRCETDVFVTLTDVTAVTVFYA